jgi:sugar (pentulose or hexulose) kinase
MKKVYIIFDIGKTNKKFFLFDGNFAIVEQETINFEEISDEDGYPCDDILEITSWVKSSVEKVLFNSYFEVLGINFSTYGASLIHINENGEVISPLYNYLKPLESTISDSFFEKYGPKSDFGFLTGSPSNDCLLNSGMQLYWLKMRKPTIYNQICTSLHFPQYLSYLFTSKVIAEYTSVGCHTAMWDYKKGQFHHWIMEEGIDHILPTVDKTNQKYDVDIDGKNIAVGIGIHDSSAALVPYLLYSEEPFLLLSTGTWSVSLNPFFEGHLSAEDVEQGCLNYLRSDGKVVMAGRIMLGAEYVKQVEKLNKKFTKDSQYCKKLKFDSLIFKSATQLEGNFFTFHHFGNDRIVEGDLLSLDSYEIAYTKLILELVECQIASIRLAVGDTNVKKIYVDGGFVDNYVFLNILAIKLKGYEVFASSMPNGSALGALLMMKDNVSADTLQDHIGLRRILPNM